MYNIWVFGTSGKNRGAYVFYMKIVYCFIAYNCDSIQQKWKNRHDGHTYAIWQIVFTYDARTRRDNVEADDYGLLFSYFFLHAPFVSDWFYFRLFLSTNNL